MKKCLFIFSAAVAALIFAAAAEAATLELLPSSGIYHQGEVFRANVIVDSPDIAVNAAEAVLRFNPAVVQVEAVSKNNSIFTLWTAEPTFSNSEGTVSFGGGSPAAFRGENGLILGITFKAASPRPASIYFESGAVLAADGRGTNVLSEMKGASYNIQPKTVIPLPEYISPPGAPPAPLISSPTHPNQDRWYKNSSPRLEWNVPENAKALRFSLKRSPSFIPDEFSSELINAKEYKNLEDGIWYFQLQFQNEAGWGGVSLFKIQIDTKNPEPFIISFPGGKETDNPRPLVNFKTTDKTAGIERYLVKIGEGDIFELEPAEIEGGYNLPLQAPGKRVIFIQAVDKAGNSISASEEFIILPIDPPQILNYPSTLLAGELLRIEGQTLPNAGLTLFLQREREELLRHLIRVGPDGKFSWVFPEKLRPGVYHLWAEAEDIRGAKSLPSEKITFIVSLPATLRIGRIVIDYLKIIATLLILAVGTVVTALYVWHRISAWRRRLKAEAHQTERSIKAAFDYLRREIEGEIAKLDKKPGLSKKEEELLEKLRKLLDESRERIGKEVETIEKELE